MNKELMEALDILEKEKEISKETLFEAIENSLLTACKNHFGKADNAGNHIFFFFKILIVNYASFFFPAYGVQKPFRQSG